MEALSSFKFGGVLIMVEEFLGVFKTRRVYMPVRCKIDFDSDGEEAFYVFHRFFLFFGRWVKRFKNFRGWFSRREEVYRLNNGYDIDKDRVVYFFDVDIRDLLSDVKSGSFANTEQEIMYNAALTERDASEASLRLIQDNLFLAANREAALDSVKRDVEFARGLSTFNPFARRDVKKKNTSRGGVVGSSDSFYSGGDSF